MNSAIKQSVEKDMPLRFVTNNGVSISGATQKECVEDYVKKETARLRADIAEDHARIMNARMQIAELMQAIEDSENRIATSRQLISDFNTWIEWQRLSPEEYMHILTTPIPF